jgi:hypothetical protein
MLYGMVCGVQSGKRRTTRHSILNEFVATLNQLSQQEAIMSLHHVESLLEPGDVLFTSIPNFLYRRVAKATGSVTSHVGIAFYDSDAGWLVAESAVPTVRYTPIADFISRSDKGWLVVRRMRGGLTFNQVTSLRHECNKRMGKLYHLGFHYSSSRQFCSKFVYETYLAALGVKIGTLESFLTLLNSLPDTPLLFWRLWFLGRIPWSRLTVTPASQFTSDKLETVWETQCSFNCYQGFFSEYQKSCVSYDSIMVTNQFLTTKSGDGSWAAQQR